MGRWAGSSFGGGRNRCSVGCANSQPAFHHDDVAVTITAAA